MRNEEYYGYFMDTSYNITLPKDLDCLEQTIIYGNNLTKISSGNHSSTIENLRKKYDKLQEKDFNTTGEMFRVLVT
jgi:hypothetical protein